MSIFRKLLAFSVILMTCQSTSASAQISGIENEFDKNDTQARITLTIPFGTATKSSKDATRLELGIRQYRQTDNIDWALRSGAIHDREFVESKFGLTLSSEPVLMMNGQVLELSDESKNLNDVEKVGIGVAVVAVIAVGGAYWFAHELSEVSE